MQSCISMHKNNNNARGNFVIYAIELFGSIFKIGKADADRITLTSGLPTRAHQQLRLLRNNFGNKFVDFFIIKTLFSVTTKNAKDEELATLENEIKRTGEVPEGNKKSYRKNKAKK